MCKRVFSVLGVFFICLALIGVYASPVSAASPEIIPPPAIFQTTYSPLYFDFVSTNALEVPYIWPYNVARDNAYREEFSYGNGEFIGEVTVDTYGDVIGDFYFPDLASGSSFSLFLSAQGLRVLNFSDDHFILRVPGMIGPTSVEVRCNVLQIVDEPPYAFADSVLAGGTYTVSGGQNYVDLNEAIHVALGSPDQDLFVQDLLVTVNFPSNFDPSIGFSVDASGFGSPPSSAARFENWFDLQNVVIDPADTSNLLDGLKRSVQGFLDLQLFPGISLNSFLFLVLTVLIIFAILRALR